MQTCTQAIWSLKSVRNDFSFCLTAPYSEEHRQKPADRLSKWKLKQIKKVNAQGQMASIKTMALLIIYSEPLFFPSILWNSITQISMFGRYIAMPERNMVNLTITMTREELQGSKAVCS